MATQVPKRASCPSTTAQAAVPHVAGAYVRRASAESSGAAQRTQPSVHLRPRRYGIRTAISMGTLALWCTGLFGCGLQGGRGGVKSLNAAQQVELSRIHPSPQVCENKIPSIVTNTNTALDPSNIDALWAKPVIRFLQNTSANDAGNREAMLMAGRGPEQEFSGDAEVAISGPVKVLVQRIMSLRGETYPIDETVGGVDLNATGNITHIDLARVVSAVLGVRNECNNGRGCMVATSALANIPNASDTLPLRLTIAAEGSPVTQEQKDAIGRALQAYHVDAGIDANTLDEDVRKHFDLVAVISLGLFHHTNAMELSATNKLVPNDFPDAQSVYATMANLARRSDCMVHAPTTAPAMWQAAGVSATMYNAYTVGHVLTPTPSEAPMSEGEADDASASDATDATETPVS